MDGLDGWISQTDRRTDCLDGRMNWIDRRITKQTNAQMEGRTDIRTDERTDGLGRLRTNGLDGLDGRTDGKDRID